LLTLPGTGYANRVELRNATNAAKFLTSTQLQRHGFLQQFSKQWRKSSK